MTAQSRLRTEHRISGQAGLTQEGMDVNVLRPQAFVIPRTEIGQHDGTRRRDRRREIIKARKAMRKQRIAGERAAAAEIKGGPGTGLRDDQVTGLIDGEHGGPGILITEAALDNIKGATKRVRANKQTKTKESGK